MDLEINVYRLGINLKFFKIESVFLLIINGLKEILIKSN